MEGAQPPQAEAIHRGALAAFVIEAITGLTAAAISMLVPVTFYLHPPTAPASLYVLAKFGRFGSSISVILFHKPDTATSATTLQDGYPMTKRGQAGKAMKTARLASVYGDTISERS